MSYNLKYAEAHAAEILLRAYLDMVPFMAERRCYYCDQGEYEADEHCPGSDPGWGHRWVEADDDDEPEEEE